MLAVSSGNNKNVMINSVNNAKFDYFKIEVLALVAYFVRT